MPFSPLGAFDPAAFIDPKVVAAARDLKAKLPAPPANFAHGLSRIYAHWTAAPGGCDFSDYNGEAKMIGGAHVLSIEHSPLDQIAGLNANSEIAGTWHRNTGSIACAITGMDGATTTNFGEDGVTVAGLTYLCALLAAFATKYGLDVRGKVPPPGVSHAGNNGATINTTGEWVLLTHGEVAQIDGYPGERWDLSLFAPLPEGVPLTAAFRSMCGNAIRAMTYRFTLALK